ncbi:hypothetical protein [Pseudoteredinibacter isoporae]|uniref:hypothetical protein n=1 Tax=Pseudoteredinibacter isoporae TaxID=570281 RepID=UPI00310345C7
MKNLKFFFSFATDYNAGFKSTENDGIYTITIYTGGFAGAEFAQKKLLDLAKEFKPNSNPIILSEKRKIFPLSKFQYSVKFN